MNLENLTVWIASPNSRTRAKLREVLKAVIYKANIQIAQSLQGFTDGTISNERPQFIFASFSLGKEPIAKYLEQTAGLAGKEKPTVILTMDAKGGDDAASIAALYLKGAAGFISEPYSTTELSQLLTTLLVNPPSVDDKSRALKATGFMLSDAMAHLDLWAAQRMRGNESGGYAHRDLKALSKDLSRAYDADTDGYSKIICDVFEKARPPAESLMRTKIKRPVVRLVHPGTIIQEVMKQRLLTAQRVATMLKMEEPDFEALLNGKRDVDADLSKELARVLGRSSREWLKLQTDYDASKPKGDTPAS